MAKTIAVPLFGGPLDGQTLDIHPDQLKIRPIVGLERDDGTVVEYRYDGEGKFIWISDPSQPTHRTGIFVFDDDGNMLSEENTIADALDRLSKEERDPPENAS